MTEVIATPIEIFSLANVQTSQDWGDRAIMYRGLIPMRDDKSLTAVRHGLIHDPITECRESILRDLQQQGEVVGVIDAIVVIADAKDAPHRAVTASRMADQWTYNLQQYLEWAQTRDDLDDATLKKVRSATALMKLTTPRRHRQLSSALRAIFRCSGTYGFGF